MRWNLRKRNARRAIWATLGALFLALAAYQVWGTNGYMAYRRKLQEEREWLERREKIRRENEAAQQRIHELRSDPKAIEKIAREEMMMAAEGDKVIKTPEKK